MKLEVFYEGLPHECKQFINDKLNDEISFKQMLLKIKNSFPKDKH